MKTEPINYRFSESFKAALYQLSIRYLGKLDDVRKVPREMLTSNAMNLLNKVPELVDKYNIIVNSQDIKN